MRDENRKARMLRGLSGKSQGRTAREIGRSPAQIDQWEQGKVVPGEDDLRLLAERGAGITNGDADELMALYQTQSQAFRRRSEGMGAVMDALAETLLRHCSGAVRRLLKLPFPDPLPSAEDRVQAEKQFKNLKRLDARSRLAVVRLGREYRSWALVERCCEAAVEEGSCDLKGSASWARLALAIAKWVPGPEGWRKRVRGYALAHWANVLRVRGDLITAELRLREAKDLWLAASDPAGLLDAGKLLGPRAPGRGAPGWRRSSSPRGCTARPWPPCRSSRRPCGWRRPRPSWPAASWASSFAHDMTRAFGSSHEP